MGILDSINPRKIRERMKQKKDDKEFNAMKEWAESGMEKYGFRVLSVENNMVLVQNRTGKQILFEAPYSSVPIHEYDAFVARMQSRHSPLPSWTELSSFMIVSNPHDYKSTPVSRLENLQGKDISLPNLAKGHGLTPDEMFSMILFALAQLYGRYKTRLRDKKDTS